MRVSTARPPRYTPEQLAERRAHGRRIGRLSTGRPRRSHKPDGLGAIPAIDPVTDWCQTYGWSPGGGGAIRGADGVWRA